MKELLIKYRITLRAAIIATRYGISPIACWPLPPDASASEVLRRNLWWWFLFVHQVVASSGWIYNIYENRNDADTVIRVVSEVIAIMGTIGKMITCKAKAPDLQELIAEMHMFLKHATNEELELIQLYVDKLALPHICIYGCAVFGPITYIVGPMLTSQQPFPGDATYPFSTEPTAIWAILYLSHSLMVVQVGSMLILDFMFAILLWYTIARFEMLSNELQRATDNDDLRRCIRKHQELLNYANRLKMTSRIVAVQMVVVAIIAIAAGGFVIIRRPPLYIVAKYALFELGSAIQLFLFCWPADNLIDMSLKVGVAAYTCDWIGKSPKMLRSLFIIAQRSQVSIQIAIRGVLPPLSLQFYGTTISTSFSYLTTLRAVTGD